MSSDGAYSSKNAQGVQAMFGQIAGRYDLLNRLLSFGVDRAWRREAAEQALAHRPERVLDVATGTADLALLMKSLRPESQVVGVDFAEPMLAIGRRKAEMRGLEVLLESGDGLALPYEDGSFSALTIAYGLRNFSDYRRGLAEFHRVLRPAGRLVILEFPPPPPGAFGRLFRFYFSKVVPFVGGLLSGDRDAYSYLPDSVLRFPTPARLADMMVEAGFDKVKYKRQLLGVSALHVGDKT